MAQHYDIVIVGGGHGGAQAAIALRQKGFSGTIAIVSKEPEPPYERPPLSKDYLAGEKPFERLYIRPPSFWQDKAVDLLLGREVVSVDADRKILALSDGSGLGYGSLIWAAGGEPRALTCPGAALAGVHSVRTRADVDAMICELPTVNHAVVVGGGYIGLEAAAVLLKLGKQVTLIEALPRLLSRVAGQALSDFFADEHRAHGVDVRLGVQLAALEGEGRVSGVLLADGTYLACGMVIVGIGIDPNISQLAQAGASTANGVLVDEFCRTSLADVYAIGDCAAHANSFAVGTTIRLESVQNANDQANVVAKHILGEAEPYRATPWFWSNQYDLRLQTVGLSTGHDDAVVRGDPATRSFSVVYLRQGRVIALDCVNLVRDYAQGRKLVEAGANVSRGQVQDPGIALKDLIAA